MVSNNEIALSYLIGQTHLSRSHCCSTALSWYAELGNPHLPLPYVLSLDPMWDFSTLNYSSMHYV